MMNDPLIEKIAAKVHEQWSRWQQFQDAVCIRGETTVEFTKRSWEEWNRKASLPYDKLQEYEKYSDKKIALEVWRSLFVPQEKCLTCSNVADSCIPEDGPCNDEPEHKISLSFKSEKIVAKKEMETKP